MTRRVEFKEKEGRDAVNTLLFTTFQVGTPKDYVTSRELIDTLEDTWKANVVECGMQFNGKRLAYSIRDVFGESRCQLKVIKVNGVPTKVYKGIRRKVRNGG